MTWVGERKMDLDSYLATCSLYVTWPFVAYSAFVNCVYSEHFISHVRLYNAMQSCKRQDQQMLARISLSSLSNRRLLNR